MNETNGKVIIVEGIIGAGKTTFSKLLSEELECMWLREPDEEQGNPYLSKFYADPKRWALTMQLHLLNKRFRMHKHAQWNSLQSGQNVVLDRSYFGDTAFARLQYKTGTLTLDEYNTYTLCYHNMTSNVLLPQICIHLITSPDICAERINKRMSIQTGRECENAIDITYLKQLEVEETNMIDVLDTQGVYVIKIDWNQNRNENEMKQTIVDIVKLIKIIKPPDMLLDLHRRTI